MLNAKEDLEKEGKSTVSLKLERLQGVPDTMQFLRRNLCLMVHRFDDTALQVGNRETRISLGRIFTRHPVEAEGRWDVPWEVRKQTQDRCGSLGHRPLVRCPESDPRLGTGSL